ncbi:MAG: adenylyl-sulfate reductase subunit alpha [Desulfitobacteriaceae bacterium]|nr:adenylyl-sulfate reductase subunit alpha [Desulfitobacteriaceae bacterium]MDI6913447.1 adenylyl-sulfate reductase subunit alpha [Desulfitobacteriaceae bacterium]
MALKPEILKTDILIVGGGTAGCFSAITIAENSKAKVLIAEKAHIKRSGCLAAGVNALNAYINPGESPESYVEYVKKDAAGIIREDLVYSLAKKLNQVTQKLEEMGLPILKDAKGDYVSRGKRSIKINGENIKPLLAQAVQAKKNVQILNEVNIIDYIVQGQRVSGAYGFSLKKNLFYVIYAKAVICTTGGAAGLYKPNNPGFSRHKMWYSPFNTGAGYAMGIRAGAEMTSLEMRFIALRCKDTIAPTGTIAQGVRARQINSLGQEYVKQYGVKAGAEASTPQRLYATVLENREGRGPCYLQTRGITEEQEQELYKAYLNMAPAQTLKWLEQSRGPGSDNVEIEGTEPYVVGGHAASGYWLNGQCMTTLQGLFAAGDVAGGSPKKYVTGCLAEGEIAALAALQYIGIDDGVVMLEESLIQAKVDAVNLYFRNEPGLYGLEEVEEAMQKVMDEYAGGISVGYTVSRAKLQIAAQRIEELLEISKTLRAADLHDLLTIHEIIDRLYVCKVLIAHLEARKETRWLCYQQNADFPNKDNVHWRKYVNSRYENGEVKILLREIVKRDEVYEHSY